ncbi:MAG: phosphoribosyltransferase [Planctomycetia bacterium]|nr:phosphoribosyltransferase [Planctomycetia bacterium]
MTQPLFTDRAEAGWMLVERLRAAGLATTRHGAADRLLVLAIPRGGVEIGAVLARGLGADLDVVLARKLRAPQQPELALGAVTEDGQVYLNHFASAMTDVGDSFIGAERARQMAEIARRREMYRAVRPQVPVAGRTVIITDDGIATGATMIAALHTVRAGGAREIVVAVPVASPDRLAAVRASCDRVVCLHEPSAFWAIGQFYRDFEQVEDERVVELLRDYGTPTTKWEHAVAGPA